MSTEQQSITDLPTMLLILVALAGLVGELRQADKAGLAWSELIKRVMLRFGSSALFGMSTLMFVYWMRDDVMLAGALAIGVGLIGADVAGALYTRWLSKKSGVCDVCADTERP